jgi:hypothetical protein
MIGTAIVQFEFFLRMCHYKAPTILHRRQDCLFFAQPSRNGEAAHELYVTHITPFLADFTKNIVPMLMLVLLGEAHSGLLTSLLSGMVCC